jgi:hypothetical protein
MFFGGELYESPQSFGIHKLLKFRYASRSITGSQAAKDRVQLPEAARPAMPNGNDLVLTASLAPSQRAGPCAK